MTQGQATATPQPAPAEPRRRWGSSIAWWAQQLIPRVAGLIFLYAGASKAWDGSRIHRVFAFDGIPEPLIVPLTHVVWIAEVMLGLSLLLGIAWRRAIVAAILVLFVYSVQLAYLIVSQNPPDCACLDLALRFASAKQQLVLGLVRNAVMAACLEWVRLRMAGEAMSSEMMKTKKDG